MNKTGRYGLIVAIICIGLSGCGKDIEEVKNTVEYSNETTENSQERKTESFPVAYTDQINNVKFDCMLEIPEKFDASDFYMPMVEGYSFIDIEKAYQIYVEGKEVKEEYHDPVEADDQIAADNYILNDNTLIGITGGFLYYTPDTSIYRNVVRSSERNAPKNNFKFASGDSCVEEVKKKLKEIGCPVEEYRFDWFSTSGEEYSILEQRAVDDQAIDSQYIKQDGWTEENNAYEIYAWQTYGELPVFDIVMTTAKTRALESYQKAPISALYTEKGLLSFSLTTPPYKFVKSNDRGDFLSFSEIAKLLEQRYEDLLEDDEVTHTVTRAKLAIRTYYDEKQDIAAEPIWYFEVTDGEAVEIVLINAINGNEIFLN